MAKHKRKSSSRRSSRTSFGAELVKRLGRFAAELPKIRKLSDRFTCRTDRLPLRPTVYTPELVKQTRRILEASQPVFARFLGVSASAVRDWEQGLKQPRGSACRLMDEIRRDPTYWRLRLEETAEAMRAI
ncbi:MAG TPA: hypothetical protein VFB96_14805 [Pirellulaceae bacterium]|nr:hypothetical protein [Pirellulaceae bacterium]